MLDSGEKLPLDLKAGDKVLIGKWSGTEVKIDGEELLILKEDEILGVSLARAAAAPLPTSARRTGIPCRVDEPVRDSAREPSGSAADHVPCF